MPQRIEDDRAFPSRISMVTPWNGFGQRIDVYLAWLAASAPMAQPGIVESIISAILRRHRNS